MIFYDRGKFNQERFLVNTHNLQSTIVFMPLKKRVVEKKGTAALAQKKGGARKVVSYNEYEKKIAEQKKKKKKAKTPVKKNLAKPQVIKPVIKKEEAKPQSEKKSPTLLQQDTKKIESKVVQAEIEKKAVKKKNMFAAKKVAEKKAADKQAAKVAADKKLLEQAKIAVKKEKEEKKVEPPIEKKSELEKIEKADEQVLPEIELIEPEEQDNDEELSIEDDIDVDAISFVGSHDLEMIQINEQIQLEIVKYYKPPVGISKKAVCELVVVVGFAGKAERVTVKKGSGSMANDICARAALLKVTFPKEVIGKEIIVELGQ